MVVILKIPRHEFVPVCLQGRRVISDTRATNFFGSLLVGRLFTEFHPAIFRLAFHGTLPLSRRLPPWITDALSASEQHRLFEYEI